MPPTAPPRILGVRAAWGAWGVWALGAVFGLSSGSTPPVASAADTVPGAHADEIGSALDALRSPFLREREEGVGRLIALGDSARAAVLRQFQGAPPESRRLLIRVMAADGSVESLNALLSTFVVADESTARAIQKALIEHAEAVEERVTAWYTGKEIPPRIRDLAGLLRRARIEKAFLSKKSRSGGTGYYRGQFELLLPDRQRALDICLKIFEDQPVKLPGEFPAGGFRFLREPPFFVDSFDLRLMAGNAVAELANRDDSWALDQLEFLYDKFSDSRNGGVGLRAQPEDAYLDTILSILYRLRGGRYVRVAESRVGTLSRQDPEQAAALLLRLGLYEEAVIAYGVVTAEEKDSAIPFYNLACAFAAWSLEDVAKAVKHRSDAMRNLQRAVKNGYLDWPWMEQDRDLDPVRDMPEYGVLLARIKAGFVAPGPPAPAPPVDPGALMKAPQQPPRPGR